MNSKKINQLATELTPSLSDLTIIGDPSTGISKKITLSQMASLFTGTVEEYANLASFPLVGTADTIYIALDTNIIYRWNTGTSAYVELSPNIVTSLVFSDANGFDGTISLVGSTATLTITTALTQGSVPFIGASGALSQDNANLFFDDTNNRLGVNTNVPTTALDVFGSGIIGRLNGTSTNNAFLGFASAGSNKWSIGNVQSDHRFRIYNEATTSELVSVLQTGEFGIGIANPLTKLHIFGGASALIANLDANTSVAKSISFRSGNSSRINLEVSGTESGSNAGANLFIRTYTDAGSLLETPFQIIRSTGITTIKELSLTNALSIANGGTGSTTKNFVDLTTSQTIAGNKTFSNTIIAGLSNGNIRLTGSTDGFLGAGASDGKLYLTDWSTGAKGLIITLSSGASTFSNYLGINGSPGTSFPLEAYINSSTAHSSTSRGNVMRVYNSNTGSNIYAGIELGGAGTANDGLAGINAVVTGSGSASLNIYTRDGGTFSERVRIDSNGQLNMSPYHTNAKFCPGADSNHYLRYLTSLDGLELSGYQGVMFSTLGGSERMRIGSGGEVKITGAGSSNTAFSIYDDTARRIFCIPSQYYGYILAVSVASNGGKAISIGNAGGASEVGSIVANASSTTYNTTSDYRLKEDLKDFDGLDILSKIKFYDFKWKSENLRTTGVIAHELQQVVPYAVNGEKDEIGIEGNPSYQGVDYSKLVAIQGRAIQQLEARIKQLESN